MTDSRSTQPTSVLVRGHEPLIGIIVMENGQEVTRYFTDEAAADAARTASTTEAALAAIGSASDVPWDEMIEGLERIRHASTPTPPIDDV